MYIFLHIENIRVIAMDAQKVRQTMDVQEIKHAVQIHEKVFVNRYEEEINQEMR